MISLTVPFLFKSQDKPAIISHVRKGLTVMAYENDTRIFDFYIIEFKIVWLPKWGGY